MTGGACAFPKAGDANDSFQTARSGSPVASAGDKPGERDERVLNHLPLVRAIAIRVYENLPVHVDVDDLVHAGIMGLFDAAV